MIKIMINPLDVFSFYKQGLTCNEIAKKYKCTRQAISLILIKHFKKEYFQIKNERAMSRFVKKNCVFCNKEFTSREYTNLFFCSKYCFLEKQRVNSFYIIRDKSDSNSEHITKRRRAKYLANKTFREKIKIRNRKLYLNNKERHKARISVGYAIKKGVLKKPIHCSQCHKQAPDEVRRIEAHHKDYSKPLEVIWLCTSCHYKEDVKCGFR